MTIEEKYWLSGLMEGEACFSSRSRGAPPRVRIQMVDKDVMDRVGALLDRAVQYSHSPSHAAKGWQPTYRVQVSGKPALDLMRDFAPLLGERRQSKIADIMAEEGLS